MSILGNRVLGGAGQQRYQVGRSLRFRSSASAYLSRTPASATNQTTWTWSAWVKRGKLGSVYQSIFNVGEFFNAGSGATYATGISFSNNDNIVAYWASSFSPVATSAAVFRDPSAWYHIVVRAGSNLLTVYVNNQQVISTSISGNGAVNNNILHYIGSNNNPNYFDGYLAEVNFIDGQALTPSSFGAYDNNGVWQPIKYGGTYGTNGFYLPFSNTTSTTTLVQDSSGNGNNWTPNNISLTAGTTYDSMIDSPTVSASASNYAVLNPLAANGNTLSSGNLNFTSPTSATQNLNSATMGMSSGKWYWEVTYTGTSAQYVGITTNPLSSANFASVYGGASDYGYYQSGLKFNNNTTSSYGASFALNDVIGVTYDASAGTLTFYKNNVSQGTAYTGLSGTFFPFWASGTNSSVSGNFNFGQRPFTYTPPTGFNALNTANLPPATIPNGALYMAATTYTANGSTQTVANSANNNTAVVFQPDLVWTKTRSTTGNHYLVDSVRGAGKDLYANLTSAETADPNYITAFNSNGFSIGSANYSAGTTMVGWQWNAGSGVTSTNTNGSITSLVSVNTTAGFSIVSYVANGVNGATVGHGLNVAPNLIIIKRRDVAGNDWNTYHSSIGNTGAVAINTTNANTTSAIYWNNTSPTSTVFSIGTAAGINTALSSYIAYCWSAVAGYSAFGSYTGNASTDGPFVYTGFRPRYVLWKNSSLGTADWEIIDSSRDPYNVTGLELYPNSSGAEVNSSPRMDFLSNGFKIRSSGAGPNGSGNTIIYAAFAENPFNNSRAR